MAKGYKGTHPIEYMAGSKWERFEYEYSVVEFVLTFAVVFFVSFFFIVSLNTELQLYGILAASVGFALILGVIWTYIRDRELFSNTVKRKRQRRGGP